MFVEEDNLCVGIITSWMKEVFEESIDTVKVDVATNNDELSLWINLKIRLCISIILKDCTLNFYQ